MELFTPQQLEKLLANGSNPDKDYSPVVKLTLTFTNCIWLLSELDPADRQIAFGLCDLGMGFPELGYVSIQEIIECEDVLRRIVVAEDFSGNFPMSVYCKAARNAEQIVTDEVSLNAAALTLSP